MKRCCLLLTILAMALFSGAGCERLQNPTAPESNDAIQKSQIKPPDYNAAEARAKLDAIAAKVRAWVAQHQAQHASKRASNPMTTAASSKVITVPNDYPTIQQAVDAAAPGDKIKVKSGTYNEFVLVDVAKIEISAVGHVVVKGGLVALADSVMIDHLSIEPLPNSDFFNAAIGVLAFGLSSFITGVEIKDNTISGGDAGVVLLSSSSCTVKANHVSGASIGGIVLSNAGGHILDGNTATGTLFGIGMSFDCDNNKIRGNSCSSNVVGILLEGTGNQLSSNTCNGNSGFGIQVITASDNTIGSGNTGDDNGGDGLRLEADAVNNVVQKNTFLNNVGFDINNLGSGNTFFKNKAVNTSGV